MGDVGNRARAQVSREAPAAWLDLDTIRFLPHHMSFHVWHWASGKVKWAQGIKQGKASRGARVYGADVEVDYLIFKTD